MCKLGDIHEVVNYAGHDGSGLVVVEVGEREALQVIEHLAAHICLDPDADDVPVVVDEIGERGLQDIYGDEDACKREQQAKVPFGDIAVQHTSCYHRIE